MNAIVKRTEDGAGILWLLRPEEYPAWHETRDDTVRACLAAAAFRAEPGEQAVIPGEGEHADIVKIIGEDADMWAIADIPKSAPGRAYRLETSLAAEQRAALALGWGLGCYVFDRYRREPAPARPVLAIGDDIDIAGIIREVEGVCLARDLINTPAIDMLPDRLAAAARSLAGRHDATFREIIGDDLLEENYPMIHAVGAASAVAPRLIDMCWGDEKAPKVTLVGKGVCFDSGGLDLKPSSGMLLMKKDMGGAANVLGLASMIMDASLPIRLRVLIPAVENAVSGNAYRPGDILKSRKGLTVEVGNTDAEGRLVLADALSAGDEENPDLLIDMATLTGAARVAVGLEIAAMFTPNDALAGELAGWGERRCDPLWRLPLWQSYAKQLDSKFADINNTGNGFGGAITAALFLQRFIGQPQNWLHLDFMGWNTTERPGRPVGGEAFAIRALYAMIAGRFGTPAA